MSYVLNLKENDRIILTPSGAYHAACTNQPEYIRSFLFMLLENDCAQNIHDTNIKIWAQRLNINIEKMLEILYTLQELKFIEVVNRICYVPKGSIEQILPPILNVLSATGKALLADHQGLYLAKIGFSHEVAEELSALSADVSVLYKKYRSLINNNLRQQTAAYGLINASGNSRISFWLLQIGDTEFNLVIAETPYLNQQAFLDLIWILSQRYAK